MKFVLILIIAFNGDIASVEVKDIPTEAVCMQIRMDLKSQLVAKNVAILAHGCYKI